MKQSNPFSALPRLDCHPGAVVVAGCVVARDAIRKAVVALRVSRSFFTRVESWYTNQASYSPGGKSFENTKNQRKG